MRTPEDRTPEQQGSMGVTRREFLKLGAATVAVGIFTRSQRNPAEAAPNHEIAPVNDYNPYFARRLGPDSMYTLVQFPDESIHATVLRLDAQGIPYEQEQGVIGSGQPFHNQNVPWAISISRNDNNKGIAVGGGLDAPGWIKKLENGQWQDVPYTGGSLRSVAVAADRVAYALGPDISHNDAYNMIRYNLDTGEIARILVVGSQMNGGGTTMDLSSFTSIGQNYLNFGILPQDIGYWRLVYNENGVQAQRVESRANSEILTGVLEQVTDGRNTYIISYTNFIPQTIFIDTFDPSGKLTESKASMFRRRNDDISYVTGDPKTNIGILASDEQRLNYKYGNLDYFPFSEAEKPEKRIAISKNGLPDVGRKVESFSTVQLLTKGDKQILVAGLTGAERMENNGFYYTDFTNPLQNLNQAKDTILTNWQKIPVNFGQSPQAARPTTLNRRNIVYLPHVMASAK